MDKKKIFNYIHHFVIIIGQALIITGITVFSVAPFSCKITSAGIEIVGGDYCAPTLQNVNIIDEKTLEMNFSEEVNLVSWIVSPVFPELSNSNEHSTTKDLSPSLAAATGKYGKIDCDVYSSDNQNFVFNFEKGTEVGKQYELLGVVKDRIGNSLTFTVPFTGYNNRIPHIIMTEIHTGMAGQTKAEKEKNIRRLEYIEFLSLTDGNLIGLELCSGAYGESKKYAFPSVEVHAGEIFVLHLRNWGEGCISEEGDDLSLSFTEYTDDSTRDLWTSETARMIGEKTDILVVKNCITDKIVDAVMYRDEGIESWSEKLKMDYSLDSTLYDVYPCGGDIENAVIANTLSASYCLKRVERENLKEAALNRDDIDYPVQIEEDSWRIDKPSLPLKQ